MGAAPETEREAVGFLFVVRDEWRGAARRWWRSREGAVERVGDSYKSVQMSCSVVHYPAWTASRGAGVGERKVD